MEATTIASTVGRLQESGAEVLAVLTSAADLERLLSAAAAIDWYPRLVVSGVLSGGVASWPSPVDLIMPPLAAAGSHAGARRFAALLDDAISPVSDAPASQPHRAMEMAAFAAAEVLVESLSRAGRDLRRARLLDQLDELRDFDTGVMPPVTFGPNRHIGVHGALVVTTEGESTSTRIEWVDTAARVDR